MKFDTVIIGGGLSGLVCGLRLQKGGKKCAIVSSGQSAMHFSSGYFDFLDRTPDGKDVSVPLDAVDLLDKEHPYSKIGKARLTAYAEEIKGFFKGCGIILNGNPLRNGYRITPMGNLKRTWLGLDDFQVLETEGCPWKKVLIANIEGFLDFNTAFIAQSLEAKGIECRTSVLKIEETERLRRNPSEMRATNIARVLENGSVEEKAVKQIGNLLQDEDAVILPAVFGLKKAGMKEAIEKALGREVIFVATMPPSVPGIRTQMRLRSEFEAAGGVFLQGDTACAPLMNGQKVASIGTVNFGDIRLEADSFVLSAGNFFSKGLTATPECIHENVFGLDTDASAARSDWYDTDFFNRQNYISYGVKTDRKFRCMKDGNTLVNLYATGSILGGSNALYEGCGAGTAIFSAFSVADTILSENA